MTDLENVEIKISNYKSFGDEQQGYDGMRSVNLIIGRNNTGKSTLLDLVDYATQPRDLSNLGHKGQRPQVVMTIVLGEPALRMTFPENTHGGPIPGNHWNFGKRWIGKPMSCELGSEGSLNFLAVNPPFDRPNLRRYEQSLAVRTGNPFNRYRFKKLLADRDINPEPDKEDPSVAPNGDGLTNVIQHFINKVGLPNDLVEETLLRELNEIFEPDGTFTDIVVQQLPDGRWELYLEEQEKGRVPLSHTGSGIKTILLVLTYLYLTPYLEDRSLETYLFGFEELENNLHPALQRRLLLYLRTVALEYGCRFFLTTHSNVAIDLFANDSEAQIVHVTHNREQARVRSVTTHVDNRGILDDLDVRASDLLQSNGIVWVEGPSDRIYFNHWVELFSAGELREGAHYQCMFYGGRLLAHLSASDPDINVDEAIKILRVNRNALVLIDSDKRSPHGRINKNKQRIRSEINQYGDMVWITAGKEIENYIPVDAFKTAYSKPKLEPLGRYEDIAEYLDQLKKKEGQRYKDSKVLFAERMLPHITMEDSAQVLDLEEKITEACTRIREWNGQKVV